MKFLRKKLFLVLCLASLACTLPAYNKYWAPFDEGIITVAAQRLLAGELPYKDFFIIMYPPGQIYILAFLFNIFSSSLIAGRIYAVFVSVGISILVFYLTFMLTRRRSISLFSWFVALISAAPRLGAIPAPIWPGVFLSLLTLCIYMQYMENLRYSYIVFTGILAGLSILFRHDIGIFVSISILTALLVRILHNRKVFREIALFAVSIFVVILPCALYFIKKSATQDIVKSLFLFPFLHEKTGGLPFPKPCFDLNMIFHGSLHFIKVNQYYIPVLVYSFTFIYLLNTFFKKRLFEKENLAILPILMFGILTFNLTRVRTDPSHLLTVIQPSAILFSFLAHKTLSNKFGLKAKTLFTYTFSALIFLLFVLLSIKNMDKSIKNSFRKVYKKDIIETRFDAGTIYVPKEERDEVLGTLNFIKASTGSDERIYVGNIAHWKDAYNGSILLYFLADRLPSTKYYEFALGLAVDRNVQLEIKESLVKHNVKLLVLQDIDLGNLRKEDVPKDRLILDDFIQREFRPVEKFGKYNIYMKK